MLKQKTIENEEAFLRQMSRKVDFLEDPVQEIANQLKDFCQNSSLAMALAAVQVGIPLEMLYLKKIDLNRLEDDTYDENRILINPVIIEAYGESEYWEACVSCLDYTGLVRRPYGVVIEYQDIEGNVHQEEFTGLPATVICHELDHFKGILHIDIASKIIRCTPEERLELRKKEGYKIIRKDGPFVKTKQKTL